MIVECPSCRTRYRTEGAGVVDGGTFFECSQDHCRHVFLYSAPVMRGNETASVRSATPPSLPPRGPGAHTPFDPSQPYVLSSRAARLGARPLLEPLGEAEGKGVPPVEAPMSPPRRPAPESLHGPAPFSFPPRHVAPDPPPDLPYELETSPPQDAPFFIPEEDEDEQSSASWQRADREAEAAFSLRSLLVLLALTVVGFAALGIYCLSHPTQTEALLARLPLLNTAWGQEQASAQQVTLADIKGGFWLTRDNKRVFAVSGKATNDAPLAAHSLQIEGTIYDAQGKAVGQQMIYGGTQTGAVVLENLTLRELAVLQDLVPPKDLRIPPGQAVKFLIVFTNPPASIAELSCRVAGAQFHPSS